jgi:SAM-dependent methyltransferase
MSLPETSPKAHSADYFGETRDFWWNADFVALMAHRYQLSTVHAGLDVGAGVGHWGRVLLPHLAPEARLVGIDREQSWVLEAHQRAVAAGLEGRLTYRLGDAAHIPFHDGVFDLVTCQTLLIHIADPRAVLREMVRVLRPGGRVVVVEPNNLANMLSVGSTLFHGDPERVLDVLRLHVISQRGKQNLGEGHNSVGDMLPGWFAEIGLEGVTVHTSDKASPLVPPYAGREQQARRAEAISWAERELYAWDRADTHRYFIAGGGTEGDFDRLWGAAGSAAREVAAALRAGTEHAAGGCVQYLVSGCKAGGPGARATT